jgi:hypothetical protein
VKAGMLIQKQQMTEKLLTVTRDYHVDKTGLFFHIWLSKSLTFRGNCCHDGTKSEPPLMLMVVLTATTCS